MSPTTMSPAKSTTTTSLTHNLTKSFINIKFIPNPTPFPTYFISHGAPTFLYKDDSFSNIGAYNLLTKLGSQLKTLPNKPDYIIMVSAHWQSQGSNLIEITYPFKSKTEENSLIYDFYGFPNHLYKEQFHSKSNYDLIKLIKDQFVKNGFNTDVVDRGLDHGAWIPLKILFANYNHENGFKRNESSQFDLDIPVIQISLTSNDQDFNTHYKLGQVLNHFKTNYIVNEQGQQLSGLILCSGMTVHNLRDLSSSFYQKNQIMPYVKPFNAVLKDALINSTDSSQLLSNLNNLKSNPLLRRAHPTLEHFLPIVVASGTITGEKPEIKELYNDENLSLGWGIYQFN